MTNQTLQTICQYGIAIGISFTAIGTLGAYIFGQKVQREKEAVSTENAAEQDAKQAYVGRLKPEQKLLLSAKQKVFPKLEFGDSGAIFVLNDPQGGRFFKIAEDNDIIINIEDGQLRLSTKIRDQRGQIIAEITDNEWKVDQDNSWDRNYSKDSLEVRDPTGDVVLQVKLVGDRVQFQAKLYDATGRRIGLGKSMDPKAPGGIIEMTGSAHPRLTMEIEPIFKYPSDLHFGELTDGND